MTVTVAYSQDTYSVRSGYIQRTVRIHTAYGHDTYSVRSRYIQPTVSKYLTIT
jgi:hypothetical protein